MHRTYPGSLRRLPDDLPAAKRAFLEELRRVYYRTGRTMRQLEDELHVSDSNWSRYLNGTTPIPDPALRELARAAGLRRREWATLVALHTAAAGEPPGAAGPPVPAGAPAPTAGAAPAPAAGGTLGPPAGARAPAPPAGTSPAAPDGAAGPADPVPRQLPAAPTAFTGRTEALRAVDAALDRQAATDGVPVLVVGGSAGVGKTALVVHWAHRVAARFPAGQLFVDLQGHLPGAAPLAPATALARMLRALGVARVPVGLDELVGAYRSLLADRRLLVVLDNAADEEQVRPLVPGGDHCAVVVTSRSALPGLAATHGARHHELGCLSEPDAVALLASLLPAGAPDTAACLARRCAYLPLALRIAAARLQTEPHLSAGDLADRLASGAPLDALAVGASGETAVRAAFHVSYEHLDPGDRRAFRLLSAVPGADVDTTGVAALLGVEVATARVAAARLTAAHLVDEHAPGRFRQHDLLRAYAAERHAAEDGEAERAAASARLYAAYLARAGAAADLIAPGTARLPGDGAAAAFAHPGEALAWTRAEHANLVSAVSAAGGGATPAYSWRLADALRAYFRQHGDGADWLLTAQTGLAAAVAAGDRAGEAAMRISLGQASWRRGDFASALLQLGAAVAAARAVRWTAGLATAHGATGTVLENTGRLAEAARHHRRALALDRRAGDRPREAADLTNLGGVFYDTGRLARAADYYLRSLALRRELGDARGVAINLANLGMVRHQQGRLDEARAHVVEALAEYRRIGGRNGEIECLDTQAQVERDVGDVAAAARLAATAFEAARSICDRRLVADTGNTLGTVELRSGRPVVAGRVHAAALAEARAIGYPYGEAAALLGAADVAVATDRAADGVAAAADALRVTRDASLRALEARALLALGRALLAAGRTGEAYATAGAAAGALHSTGQEGALAEARLLVDCAAPASPRRG